MKRAKGEEQSSLLPHLPHLQFWSLTVREWTRGGEMGNVHDCCICIVEQQALLGPPLCVWYRGWSKELKERWLKWSAKDTLGNFWLINYSLGHVNCLVWIHVLLQLSVFYHHHHENEASYAVWLSCFSLPCLSNGFTSHHTLCLQEWFVQVNQRVIKERILWTLHIQGGGGGGGWLAIQSTLPPRISSCGK